MSEKDGEFLQDEPRRREGDGDLDIFEKCGRHATTMKEIGKVIVKQTDMLRRQDDFDIRLSAIEKTHNQLDRIESLLVDALKRK
jgi:hypothetical protein